MSTQTAWQQSLATLLAEIKKAMNTGKDVILLAEGTKLSPEKWTSDGCPHTLELVESRLVDGYYYRVFLDTGYGHIILVRGSDTMCRIAYGKHMAHIDEPDSTGAVIAMDKDYYGLHKYLWR